MSVEISKIVPFHHLDEKKVFNQFVKRDKDPFSESGCFYNTAAYFQQTVRDFRVSWADKYSHKKSLVAVEKE